MAADRGPAVRGGRRRGDHHARRPPPGPVPGAARSRRSRASAGPSRRSTTRAGIAIPAHPLVPYPMCAQGPRSAGSSRATTPRRAPTRSRPSTPRRSAGTATARWSGSPSEHGLARARQQRRAHRRRDRHRLDDLPGPDRRRTTAARSPPARRATTAASTGRCGQLGVYGRQLRKYSRGLAGGRRRTRPARRHGSRPGLPRRAPSARPGTIRAGGRTPAREDRPRLAVRVPAARRGDPARPLPLREPPAARA